MAILQKTFGKAFQFIDAHVPMPMCIMAVVFVSLKVALWLGNANPIGDIWCHFAWMKITHRKPISEWYDNNSFTHLDYPPLAAYVHYLMSFVYVYFNPREFYHLPLTGYDHLGPQKKEAIRQATLAADLLTYYPVVIFVVLQNLKGLRKVHQLGIMLIFLNMPMFAYIEHSNAQVNGPPLALLLLCLHFLINDRFVLATVCFTLGIMYKHAGAPMVLPITLYIIARAWHLRFSEKRNVYVKFLLVLFDGIKCALAGVATVEAVLLPLIMNPPAVRNMSKVIFGTKIQGMVHPAPTLWFFLKHFYGEDNINGWISYPFIIYGVVGALLIPLIFKKPCKETFLAAYVVFGLTHGMFGYIVHEKHIHYMYMGLLLLPVEYAHYLPYVLSISAWCTFPLATRVGSAYYSFYYALGFIIFIVTFGRHFKASCELPPLTENKEPKKVQPESIFYRIVVWAHDTLKANSQVFLTILLSAMACIYGIFKNAVEFYKHKAHEFDLISDMLIKYAFVGMLVFYAFAWLTLLKVALQKKEIHKA